MSIDFDSAALQTQHEEEEYDREDYAREQELHKLLTDLPDDMLEDSRDVSSPELNYSGCSAGDNNRPQQAWNQASEWNNPQGVVSAEQDYESAYSEDPFHGEFVYGHSSEQFDGHVHELHAPHPHVWSEQREEGHEYLYSHGGYSYPSVGNEEAAENQEGIPQNGYEQDPYSQTNPFHPQGAYYHSKELKEEFRQGEHIKESFKPDGSGDHPPSQFKVKYNPYRPAAHPNAFGTETGSTDDQYSQLQAEFLESGQNSTEQQKIEQLQIFDKARLRQIKNLEEQLEDYSREMRYLNHQLAIVRDEKEGLALSLQESGKVIKDGKEREIQLEGQIKALDLKVQALLANEEENVKKLKVAEAAVDSMQQQMAELCRSDTLTRAREEHNRVLAALREKHDEKVLALQQTLDAQNQALEEQKDICQKLQDHVKRLERQQEEDRVEKAEVINRLTKSLEESQQQCANLLQTGTIQEINQLRIQLQQAQSVKNISDNMNRSLQEEVSDLKEQITLYESAAKFGIIALDPSGELESQLSDSYVELGIKTVNWKNSKFHSTFIAAGKDKNMSKDDMIVELKTELERFLGSLKVKRRRISQLQDELKQSQSQVQELKAHLEKAEREVKDSKVRENNLEKCLEISSAPTSGQEGVEKFQKECRCLQEQLEKLEKQNKELKSANLELCTEMRNMIQDFDREKQALERHDKTHQQHRDDLVAHLRTELSREHTIEMEKLTSVYEDKIHVLQTQLSDINKEMIGVQECYITLCKEKDTLEQDMRCKMEKERKLKEDELRKQLREEKEQALGELERELGVQHRLSLATSKALWVREEAVQEAVERVEKEWARRLEQSLEKARPETESHERHCQTEPWESEGLTGKELDSRLAALRLQLQQEAEEERVRAVADAIRETQSNLEMKHREKVAEQVESAVSSAYSRWLQQLHTLPEYKTSLQAEKEEWERQRDQEVANQISAVVRAAEERWEKNHLKEMEKLEASSRSAELQEKVLSLQRQLEHRKEEEAALVKAELARARAEWNREKQEEISRIQERNEKDYRSFLDEHRNKLNEAIKSAKEDSERHKNELLLQKEAEFQLRLEGKEKEWAAQQEEKCRVVRQQCEDDMLVETQALLGEIQELLIQSPDKLLDIPETRFNNPKETQQYFIGKLRACLQAACQGLVSKAINEARNRWEKSNEEKLCRALKEAEDRHKQEIKQLRNQCNVSQPGTKSDLCCNKYCAEKLEKSQRQCQELQRHLEKACRQLQQTVRENKANMQQLRDSYEEAIKKEKAENMRRTEDPGRRERRCFQSQTDSVPDSRTQAALEEMRDQYMNAVEKIRGDMLRYIQESKERAAELIRTEVLRERQDTARRMRKYYLSCLQELLEDGRRKEGAEKKIMNAASKLAAMAKVLETPVPKRKGNKTDVVLGSSKMEASAANGKLAEALYVPLSQKHPASSNLLKSQNFSTGSVESQAPPRTALKLSEDRTREAALEGPRHAIPSMTGKSGEGHHEDPRATFAHPRSGKRKACSAGIVLENSRKEETMPKHGSIPIPAYACFGQGYRLTPGCDFSETTLANITVRNETREPASKGLGSCQAEQCSVAESVNRPWVIQETPVRDEGSSSDWTSASLGTCVESQTGLSFCAGGDAEPAGKCLSQVPSFVLPLSDSDDESVRSFRRNAKLQDLQAHFNACREIPSVHSKPRPKICPDPGLNGDIAKNREPIPGSEDKKLYKLCSKSLFSEIKASQQDSGFDSPLSVFPK
ncbi:centrosomal protein of 152 kDa isoform X2 [Lepisosteus oculatus]|uniref:centrosomal protein of 152 kDa isoform X2 n=1 Tax=Lepisosteus oculatus TaxID=7918 RepID=UPI0037110A56